MCRLACVSGAGSFGPGSLSLAAPAMMNLQAACTHSQSPSNYAVWLFWCPCHLCQDLPTSAVTLTDHLGSACGTGGDPASPWVPPLPNRSSWSSSLVGDRVQEVLNPKRPVRGPSWVSKSSCLSAAQRTMTMLMLHAQKMSLFLFFFFFFPLLFSLPAQFCYRDPLHPKLFLPRF